jgi:hypothetical protein
MSSTEESRILPFLYFEGKVEKEGFVDGIFGVDDAHCEWNRVLLGGGCSPTLENSFSGDL